MTKKTTAQSAPDEHWIRTRQTILRGLKNQVTLRLGPEPKEIVKYRKKVEREFAKAFVHASKRDLLAKVASADLIFGADFHAYGQAQRTHLKILKDRPVANRPLAIALEAFAVEHQTLLDQFVLGQIDEAELLKKTNWQESWGFPWENYRPIVLFARNSGYALLAVGTVSLKATLQEREQRAADVLNAFFELNRSKKENPQVYCLFGELHLGADGLPKLCAKALGSRKIKILTIHLNSEQIYFRLAQQQRASRWM